MDERTPGEIPAGGVCRVADSPQKTQQDTKKNRFFSITRFKARIVKYADNQPLAFPMNSRIFDANALNPIANPSLKAGG
jgi:hypothetical protein